MKRISLVIVFALCSIISFAQKGFFAGGILGVGQSSFASASLDNQTNKLFLAGGIKGIYHFNNYIGIEADGLITSKGTKATGTAPAVVGSENFEERYDFVYAEVPLLAKIRFGKKDFFIKAFAGPSFNFNIDSRYSIDYTNSNNKDVNNADVTGVKVMETAFVYGAGIEINDSGTGLYSLGVRVSNGITEIARTVRNNNAIVNQYFAICLSWTSN